MQKIKLLRKKKRNIFESEPFFFFEQKQKSTNQNPQKIVQTYKI